MESQSIGYDDVLARLREAEDVIQALLNSRADAVVTSGGVHMLRLHETDRALHLAKASLEGLLADRTKDLVRANAELLQEVNERRRAEAALAASESRFRALLECASQGVIAVDTSGRIVLVNASTERMFGYDRRDLIGAPLEILVPAKLVEAHRLHRRDFTSSPADRPMGVGLELSGRRKDGTEFPVEVSLSFAEANGDHLALALVTDITQRKNLEASLRETQKLESIGLLAGGVAHDFNNLLTAILGNASLLVGEVPASMHFALQSVIDGAEKAAQVTRQLLAYAGKGHLEVSDLDLSALVRENAELIRVSIPKRVEIRLKLGTGLPLVHADAGQLQQVLMNLVINASEAIGEANGVIAIETTEERSPGPADSGQSACRHVIVTVSDNGSGMTEGTKEHIFDPFFTTKVYGRGLGLSAVMGILRSCAATISIDTAVGMGTTFRVRFPAVEGDAAPATAPAQPVVARRSGTVLVVEDEDFVRSFAVAALQRAGYAVLQASHGKEALDLLHARAVDLVLLDVTMPVMSGREALEQMKQLRPELNIMVTSGYCSDEAKRLMDLGGKETVFLQKPYTAQRLVQSIDARLAQ